MLQVKEKYMDYQKHGLKGNMKQRVFDALLQRQQGKCFICGISQKDIEAKWQVRAEDWRQHAEKLPLDDPWRQRLLRKYAKGPAPVHRKLHIDHCHTTGMIRGLLCESCNVWLGQIENYRFQEKPENMTEEIFVDLCECIDRWIEEHRDAFSLYMQRERWFPRKDILFHLQVRA